MNILDNSNELQRKRGYNHPSKQAGWTDNSYHASRTLEEANYLGDEEYHDRLGVHNPLWRYVINRYREEWDTPIIVMGLESLPLAIELSQWTYPVSMVVRNEKEIKQAESDAKRQAGTFRELTDNVEKCSKARVVIFVGLIDNPNLTDDDAKETVEFLLKGVKEVVCAVNPSSRNWRKIFGNRVVDTVRYNNGRYILLRFN